MPGLSHTLDIARRALMTQQAMMSVIGHNVANVGTAGYSRQVARLETQRPFLVGQISWGDGVRLSDVVRQRDRFLDEQFRAEVSDSGWWQTRANILGGIESLIGEPSDTGLSAVLDDFWAAWSELSSSPEDPALRGTVREVGRALADRIGSLADRLAQARADLGREISREVDALNRRLGDLADLNGRIQAAELSGGQANDLRDRRDLLLDELNRQAKVTWSEQEDGSLIVRLAGKTLVDREGSHPLAVATDLKADGTRAARLSGPDGESFQVETGRLGALLEMQQESVPELQAGLDGLAADLIREVNALHRAGPSGVDFFAGSGAADMALAAEIQSDLTAINVSTSGISGENDIALAIAQLQQSPISGGGTLTPSESWGAYVARLGTMAAEASAQETNTELATEALSNRRESVKGVSLDEEMAAMVQTQQAYLAATRLFEVTAGLFEALLEM
ncbi:MAG: flagellar hook-associated protein FlgK [Candidatus Eisenbacteria sp.]|nr:flagellar hook-associated protein FlgK [Candidatus Eisenbacteria bacterium]